MPDAAEEGDNPMNPAVRNLTRSIDIAGVASCALVVAALVFGAILPLQHHRGDSEARRTDLARQRERIASAKASVTATQAQVAKARAALERNPIRLDDARQINKRLARINELAIVRGLHVQGVDPGATHRGTRYQTIDMKLAGEGGYRGCVEFLRDMHDQFPDTAVTAFRLSGNPQETDQPAAFSFELRWYASPTEATASAQ
jgi:Tfp pilus assembly protein PilO